MPLKAVTFDCAQTLVNVTWDPIQVAVDAAKRADARFDEQVAAEKYGRLFLGRQSDYFQVSQKGIEAYDLWWRQLTVDWLQAIGVDLMYTEGVIHHANRIIYEQREDGQTSVFKACSGAEKILGELKSMGLKLAVISNWDISLHRVVELFGWTDAFELVVASHEFGVEKPEPAIFNHALKSLNVEPGEALHVGDDPIADVQGARAVGMHTFLADHSDQGFAGLLDRVRSLA